MDVILLVSATYFVFYAVSFFLLGISLHFVAKETYVCILFNNVLIMTSLRHHWLQTTVTTCQSKFCFLFYQIVVVHIFKIMCKFYHGCIQYLVTIKTIKNVLKRIKINQS